MGTGEQIPKDRWRNRWTPAEWTEYPRAGASQAEVVALRHSTHTGRQLGTPDFVAALEQSAFRPLTPQKGGRPKKHPQKNSAQHGFAFVA
jgi:hypothetical protein